MSAVKDPFDGVFTLGSRVSRSPGPLAQHWALSARAEHLPLALLAQPMEPSPFFQARPAHITVIDVKPLWGFSFLPFVSSHWRPSRVP